MSIELQLNRCAKPSEPMSGEPSSLFSPWARQDSFETGCRSGEVVWENVNNNVLLQTGEEFGMLFLQESVPSVISPVFGVAPNYDKRFGISDAWDRRLAREEFPRVPGLRRMDSECNSGSAEFSLARGYSGRIDGVYMSNGSMNKEIIANGQTPNKSAAEVPIDQACLAPTVPVLSESDSSKSLYSSAPGVSVHSKSQKIKLLCSFGGKILPRPGDGKIRYVGGETRIISIWKNLSWKELVRKTAEMCNQPHLIKYQLPGEDLDALISVSCDEDLQNMIDECRDEKADGSQRLRIFLIPLSESEAHRRTVAVNGIEGSVANGIGGTGLIPQKFYYHGLCSEKEMGPLEPSGEIYEKVVSFPMHPSNIKDTPSVPVLVESFDGSQKLIASPSLTHAIVQPPYIKNAETRMYPSNSSLGSCGPPLSLPLEDSSYYTTSQHHPPELTLNLMHSHDPMSVHDINQPNTTSPLILRGNLAPQQLEQNYGSFEQSSQAHTARMERTFNLKNPLPQPDDLAGTLLGSGDSLSNIHGIPHALSDPNLQNQGNSSAYSSLEGISQSFSLNLGRAELSSCKVSTALQEIPVKDINSVVGKSQSGKEDSKVNKTVKKEYVSSTEVNTIAHILNSAEPPAVAKRPTRALENISPEACCLDPAASSVSSKLLKDSGLEQPDVAGLTHGMSKGLVSPQTPPSYSFEGSRDVNRHELRLTEGKDLDEPKGVVNVTGVKLPHCPDLLKSKTAHLDDKMSSCTTNTVKSESGSIDISNERSKLQDVSNPANGLILSPHASDTGNTMHNLDSEDINSRSPEDRLFSDSMIAEADLYGLQIIKNADLEELRELGSGTYGMVYFGKWRGTDVAIKKINKACFSGRPSEKERLIKDFWREACILSKLHHPNVVAFYGVVPDGASGTLATVTEFMANGSLRVALMEKDKLLTHSEKLIIAMDAAFGMEYLHSKNIVHFDLKCDNLLVNLRDPQRPICKVGDFGLSKIKRNTLVSGGIRGTLPWMAPELLNGNATRVSEKVDVYSFGIVLWEILTGEEPYANMHYGAVIGGIVKNTLRPTIPEWCDPQWRKLMEQCWSADPQARPPFMDVANKLRSMSEALEIKRQTNLVKQGTGH